ncbi:ankyrin repeat domain-containing protein [Candidatus Berkiella aquae]|uniref:Ankyrin repeat domain-containing protein n=1 Tax=Candidatus Berkiella aquae TaxID=295108 RepID=A0A0Q9YY43_9GAMM|nr:ankyrin repeat domain-containing protein [Candidatus Berkiella aquae]MCS5711947.1 ankyrin repeat domain-containing protein [Candidatus Berkiella aquae]
MPRKSVKNQNSEKKQNQLEILNPLLDAIQKHDLQAVSNLIKAPEFFNQSYKDKAGNTPFHYIGEISDEKLRQQMAKKLIYVGMPFTGTNDKDEGPKCLAEFYAIQAKKRKRFISGSSNFWLIHPRNNANLFLSIFISFGMSILLAPALFLPLMLGLVLQVIIGERALQREEQLVAKHRAAQLEADFINDIKRDKLNVVKLVKYIEQGVNIHNLDSGNQSALEIAAKFGVTNQINLLAPYTKEDLLLAVYTAIGNYKMESLNLLLSKTDDVDFNYHYTPLIVAIRSKRPDMVNVLLHKGAKVSDLVMDTAKLHPNAEITRLLENAQKKAKAKPAAKPIAHKKPTNVVPMFDAKRKAASKTQSKRSATEKPATKAVNQRKQSLRSAKK